jgi:glycogen debranching enzyme
MTDPVDDSEEALALNRDEIGLEQRDCSYRPRYADRRAPRDAAYHQGTVWPFLLAPFVTAWLRLRGNTSEAKQEGLRFLSGIEDHLRSEGCLGHISEIFDGSAPHLPRGRFAQAWSLGEILLVMQELLEPS